MARANELKSELFEVCYETSVFFCAIVEGDIDDYDYDEETKRCMEAYWSSQCDCTFEIIKKFGWENKFYEYCDRRDRGWTHEQAFKCKKKGVK